MGGSAKEASKAERVCSVVMRSSHQAQMILINLELLLQVKFILIHVQTFFFPP
jgi:hypothetical protein